MRVKKIFMRIITTVFVLTVLVIPAMAVSAETAGQKAVRDAGLSVNWIDLGAEFDTAQNLWFGEADSEGFFAVTANMKDGSTRAVFINEKGERAITQVYDSVSSFRTGVAYVELAGKKMMIDNKGQRKLDLSNYDGVHTYDSEIVEVNKGGKWGIVNMAGVEVLPCIYNNVSIMRNGLIEADTQTEQGYQTGLFNRTGKAITGMDYEWIYYSGEYGANELIAVKKDGKVGFINVTGQTAIPFQYNEAFCRGENIYAVKENRKWGAINDKMTEIIPVKFDSIDRFYNGHSVVCIDSKFGYIDTSGVIVIPCEYNEVGQFSNGAANALKIVNEIHYNYLLGAVGMSIIGPKEYAIADRGMYVGHYDEYAGTDIVPPRNDTIREALLDEQGNRITGFYFRIQDFKEGLAVAKQDYDGFNNGVINKYGTEIVPTIFRRIELVDAGKCLVLVSEKAASGDEENSRIGILNLPEGAAEKRPSFSRPITVYSDGLDLYFDAEPIIVSDRTMVPMRKIFENLGAKVSWDETARKVTAVKGGVTIELIIGSKTALKNGQTVTLDAPAMINSNRTLVPLRFVAESLDCEVSWEPADRRVIITTEK